MVHYSTHIMVKKQLDNCEVEAVEWLLVLGSVEEMFVVQDVLTRSLREPAANSITQIRI